MEKPPGELDPAVLAAMTTEQKIALYDTRLTEMIENPGPEPIQFVCENRYGTSPTLSWASYSGTSQLQRISAYKARLEKMSHSERVLHEEKVQRAVDNAMALAPKKEKARESLEDKTQIINPFSE